MNNLQQGFFTKENYILLFIGLVILAIGYILMSGGGSEDPSQFNPDIFNTRRIVIAPIVVLIGYLFIIYAILKNPKKN